jgi:hypothetical protein
MGVRPVKARVLVAAVVIALVSACSHAGTLQVRLTAPTLNNELGVCPATILAPRPDSLWVFVAIPAAGIRDSVWSAPGALLSFTYQLPAGPYNVRAYAASWYKGTLYPGCDTVATLRSIAAPHHPGLLP